MLVSLYWHIAHIAHCRQGYSVHIQIGLIHYKRLVFHRSHSPVGMLYGRNGHTSSEETLQLIYFEYNKISQTRACTKIANSLQIYKIYCLDVEVTSDYVTSATYYFMQQQLSIPNLICILRNSDVLSYTQSTIYTTILKFAVHTDRCMCNVHVVQLWQRRRMRMA